MKRIFFGIQLFSCLSTAAQTNAVTSNGEEVILYSNGTWRFVNKEDSNVSKLDTNKIAFTKTSEATFLLKSNVTSVGINFNPKKWSFKKSTSNKDAEYSFQLKDNDAYGMMITERIEVPLESLKNIALENARNIAPDIKAVKEEYRNVNGVTVLFMQLNGTTQGIKFTYLGYYFSNEKGTVQLVSYTPQSLLNEYKTQLMELLNGLVVLN